MDAVYLHQVARRGKEIVDHSVDFLHRWEDNSRHYIGTFLQLFGPEGWGKICDLVIPLHQEKNRSCLKCLVELFCPKPINSTLYASNLGFFVSTRRRSAKNDQTPLMPKRFKINMNEIVIWQFTTKAKEWWCWWWWWWCWCWWWWCWWLCELMITISWSCCYFIIDYVKFSAKQWTIMIFIQISFLGHSWSCVAISARLTVIIGRLSSMVRLCANDDTVRRIKTGHSI